MANARLRAAVVGTGGWSQTHIRAYWSNPETELVAVCAHSNRPRAEAVARQYGARAYLNIAAMLEKERPDLVSVLAPDDQHFQPYKEVLAAGVPCLLEKPLALDVAQGRELVRLARAKKVFCGINFNHRYATPFLLLARHLAEGKLGRPIHLLWRFTGGHYPEGQTSPLAHLLYMQAHGFNLLQTFGGPIAGIAGHAAEPRGTQQFTSATFSVQFVSGAVGTIVASVDGDYKDPGVYSFEIMGDRGRAVVSDAIRRFEFCPRREAGQTSDPLAQVWSSHFFDDDSRQFGRTTDRHLAAFIQALRAGAREPIPIEEGLAALEAGTAAIRAALENRVVKLDTDGPVK